MKGYGAPGDGVKESRIKLEAYFGRGSGARAGTCDVRALANVSQPVMDVGGRVTSRHLNDPCTPLNPLLARTTEVGDDGNGRSCDFATRDRL